MQPHPLLATLPGMITNRLSKLQSASLLLTLLRIPSFAQAPPAAPANTRFEVASIRPHGEVLHSIMDFSSSGPRVRLEGYTINDLILEAYDLRRYKLLIDPAILKSTDIYRTYYDLTAVADGIPSPTRAQFRAMLQTLLAERFALRIHSESRDLPVFALIQTKSGPKFKPSAADAAWSSFHDVHGTNQTINAVKQTMAQLADDLDIYVYPSLAVIDKTGLTGQYDLNFEATPGFRINSDPQPDSISVFAAVQQQLGLKLVPEKALISVLVVDHAESPTAN